MRVDRRDIRIHALLGQGGIGRVFQAVCSGPGLPGVLVYKEILGELTDELGVAIRRACERSVDLLDGLTPDDQAELDPLIARPLATVVDDGSTVGVLMRMLPPRFFQQTASGRRPRELQLLNASPEHQRRLGMDLRAVDYTLARLSVLSQVAYALDLLHRNNLIFGDLSLRNIAVGAKPPRAMLLDCDGIASHSDASRVQANAPFFVPPEIQDGRQRLQDRQTDVYKMGLCVVRGLSQGRGATQFNDPRRLETVLDDSSVALVRRALSPDRAERPPIGELREMIEQSILESSRTVLPLTSVDLVAFISYRRIDTMHGAHRLYDYISRALGRGSAFIDMNMPKGIDFVKAIEEAIAACRVLIAVIGPGWLDAVDDQGLRLDDSNDFVRVEIETAFRLGIPVLPVLIDGASMPRASRLPASLARLSRISACIVRGDRFDVDCAEVMATVEKLKLLAPPRPDPAFSRSAGLGATGFRGDPHAGLVGSFV